MTPTKHDAPRRPVALCDASEAICEAMDEGHGTLPKHSIPSTLHHPKKRNEWHRGDFLTGDVTADILYGDVEATAAGTRQQKWVKVVEASPTPFMLAENMRSRMRRPAEDETARIGEIRLTAGEENPILQKAP
nr:unnamed protein product [Digitaria exilis]